jgi:hypothetical protein
MKKYRYAILAVLVSALLAATFIILVKPPLRVEIYDAGGDTIDIEVKSIGEHIVMNFNNGDAQIAPFWEQPNSDILIKDDLIFRGVKYHKGDVLALDSEGRIIKQRTLQSFWNNIRYYTWKIKQPKEPKPKSFFVRAKEAHLRSKVEDLADAGKLSFGNEVLTLATEGDWLKVRASDKNLKARGWLHRSVVTESRDQIERMKKEDKIPDLILLIKVESPQRLITTTLAGGIKIPNKEIIDEGLDKVKPRLYPNDCLIFDKDGIEQIPKPFSFMGQSIDDPSPGKIYILNKSNKFEIPEGGKSDTNMG